MKAKIKAARSMFDAPKTKNAIEHARDLAHVLGSSWRAEFSPDHGGAHRAWLVEGSGPDALRITVALDHPWHRLSAYLAQIKHPAASHRDIAASDVTPYNERKTIPSRTLDASRPAPMLAKDIRHNVIKPGRKFWARMIEARDRWKRELAELETSAARVCAIFDATPDRWKSVNSLSERTLWLRDKGPLSGELTVYRERVSLHLNNMPLDLAHTIGRAITKWAEKQPAKPAGDEV